LLFCEKRPTFDGQKLEIELLKNGLSGAAIMCVISSGCAQLGVVNATQDIMIGVIIIGAVAIDQLRNRKQD
jgi:ribose/xylose/arabinose/galactoside ABC-type transport system permease subunit